MRHVGVRFSDVEIVDLVKAWLATSLAFGVFFLVGSMSVSEISFASFIFVVGIAAITAGLGFIGHELMHKFTANHFGVQAEFRSNDQMLVISIIIAFFGLILAAPGAVQIYGNITRRESGLISVAGPAANIVLALLFLPLALYTIKNGTADTLLGIIGMYGLMINGLLGAFNLIPFWGFDGEKVLNWHKGWYFTALFIAGILVVSAFAITTLG
jgi:Zn-dependent protease